MSALIFLYLPPASAFSLPPAPVFSLLLASVFLVCRLHLYSPYLLKPIVLATFDGEVYHIVQGNKIIRFSVEDK
ncbi:MAG: hypothetical protein RBQ94_04475 [Methanimicrococcus sp.]|nr:hypothetical protein [Methanimicrococcus sp.]